MAQMVARYLGVVEAVGSSPVTQTKNPSTLSADFLFKPIGLVYHHALACISLPHSCGVYHHTVGVYTFIGLMRYSGFATDDMQNLRFDDIQGFALILKPSIYTFFHILLLNFTDYKLLNKQITSLFDYLYVLALSSHLFLSLRSLIIPR